LADDSKATVAYPARHGPARQWELQDIEELERGNPYQLEIKPFAGNDYRFQLLGKGMDSRE
jgi:hypothetical protein